MLFFVISDLKVTFCTKPHFSLLERNSSDFFDLLKTSILKDPDMGVQEIVLLLNFVTCDLHYMFDLFVFQIGFLNLCYQWLLVLFELWDVLGSQIII